MRWGNAALTLSTRIHNRTKMPSNMTAIAIMITLNPAKFTPAAHAKVSCRESTGSPATTRLATVAAATTINPISATTIPTTR